MPVIDFHAHYMVGDVLEQCHSHSPATGFGVRPASPAIVAAFEKMKDPVRFIDDMDRMGIKNMVLSSSTVLSPTSWAEPAAENAFVRRLNDVIADWQTRFPERIIGSFVLPLQDMELALKELTRVVDDLGLGVVNLSSHVRGAYMGDEAFAPFWEAVQDRNLVTFMHPEGGTCEWFQQYGFWNSLGVSFEEAKFLASMIFEGTLDRFPQLKIVVTHGGGYFPHNMGRLDRNAEKHAGQHEAKNISASAERVSAQHTHYDTTCLYDPTVLTSLIGIVGHDRLTLGSDYAVGDYRPGGLHSTAAATLSDAQKTPGPRRDGRGSYARAR